MAKNESKRIRPIILKADQEAYMALLSLGQYAPVNPEFTKTKVTQAFEAQQATRQPEIDAQNALDAARDNATAAEWAFHNAMLGVKTQVIAQYGVDSNEAQALGLVKKSERKTRTPKPKTAA
jgi:hypothetical protein